MQTYLVVSAIGKDRTGLVGSLSQSVLECGCHIGESRMAVLGSEFAAVMLITGYWNAIAKLESALPRVADSLGLRISSTRTEAREDTRSLIPYAVEVIAPESTEVVHEVSSFFARRGINIEDVYTNRYPAPQTGAAMFAVHLTLGIPSDLSIASIRGEFMDFCDELNLDAMIAPVK